jgi:pimeloyl-ACP methyl ester carboxylesterase
MHRIPGQGRQARLWPAFVLGVALAFVAAAALARPTPTWLTLQAPPPLPAPAAQGYVEHDGARIWYASFGDGPPVILLHGGASSSDDWGFQVPTLVAHAYRVIVIDSRGQGRSTRDGRPLHYAQMEADVVAVMDQLGVRRAPIVGWSDGAIVALIMAMHDPNRVGGVFAFGANMDVGALRPIGVLAAILPRVNALLKADYERISPTPGDYGAMSRWVLAMQLSEPHYSAQDLAAIHAGPVVIADGDHEEFIRRTHTRYLARTIPGAQLLLLKDVSHFAPLQDPAAFSAALLDFLSSATIAPAG